MTMRPDLLLATALVLASSAAPALQPVSIGLAPSIVNFEGKPGDVAVQKFALSNKGTNRLTMKLKVADVWFGPDGSRTFPPAGQAPQGLGAWLTPPPDMLVLEPGDTAEFEGRISVPDGTAPGTYYGAYLARLIEDEIEEKGPLLKQRRAAGAMSAQVGMIVIVDVTDTGGIRLKPTLKLVDGKMEGGKGKPVTFSFLIENASRAGTKPSGELLLTDGAQIPVGRVELERALIMPTQSRWVSGKFSAPLPPGKYTAVVAIDSPEGGLTTATLNFELNEKPDAPPKGVRPDAKKASPRQAR